MKLWLENNQYYKRAVRAHWKGYGANRPYLQSVAELRDQVERHIEDAFGSRHTTTHHGSQLKTEKPEENRRTQRKITGEPGGK